MMGNHCIKTWSATQGAYALSSAEAELYAMVEAVSRAKGLVSLARELGFSNMTLLQNKKISCVFVLTSFLLLGLSVRTGALFLSLACFTLH